jgi:hypothetical protein
VARSCASLADALAVLAAAWPNAARFLAADAAKLITLREFLFPKVAPTHAVTAKATAKRLKRHVSEPVPKDDKTLILKEFLDTYSKVTGYYVLVK